MSSVRDSRRSRVYDAERLVRSMFDNAGGPRTVELHGSRLTLPVERRFASLASVQEYCDRVLSLNWVRGEWARASVPLIVRARRGSGAAHYEYAGAALAVPVGRAGTWALRELVLLHEIAHHLDPSSTGSHDREFCLRYLELVSGVIGAEAALVLRVALHDCGALAA